MIRTVWKYPLAVADVQHLLVPEGAVALCVQVQGFTPCLWLAVDPDAGLVERRVLTVGTGHDRPEIADAGYLGSFQVAEGTLVFHVFDGGLVLP